MYNDFQKILQKNRLNDIPDVISTKEIIIRSRDSTRAWALNCVNLFSFALTLSYF